jgi:hypothetical protein
LREFARGELLGRNPDDPDGRNTQDPDPTEERELDEHLVFDLYLRENCRNRPDWAGEYDNSKGLFIEFLHQFFDKQQAGGVRSMSNSMHGELFYTDIMQTGYAEPVFIVFDYRKRNPVSGNAEFKVFRLAELQ